MSNFQSNWKKYVDRCETSLQRYLTSDIFLDSTIAQVHSQDRLSRAMAYSVLSGGKRLRATLVYACGELLNTPLIRLDAAACAVEMVHTYSLIHDDLPAMDNGALRRGKPTCHIQFDEATAILAGDALQSKAFEILANNKLNSVDAERRSKMVFRLATAIGVEGMAGGQSLDIQAETLAITCDELAQLHSKKTGALIKASVILGCLAGEELPSKKYDWMLQFAEKLGVAFQIVDDILDHTGDSKTLGKPSGSDQRRGKSTYVSLLGLNRAKKEAQKLINQSTEIISNFGNSAGFLQQLAIFAITRNY